MYTEIFIDECYDIQLDEKSLNIIDIGSNVGMFIIRMKQLYPQCLINGYEPLPANFKQLSDNLKENHYQNYEVFQKGIGNSKRIEKLYINLKNNGGNSLFKNQTNSSVYTEIELIDVDEMLKNLGHENCNLLKLDCEGAELEILKSLTPETAARIKRIIYEPTPSIYNPLELNDYLVTLGYIFEKETLYGLYIAYYSGKPN
jgi:FkbM family methyltransferase